MSFISELKRRNVFKVSIAYAVASWLLLQIVDLVLENINAPDWVMQVFMLGLAVGFPIAIIVAWAFELTPDGVKFEKNVDRNKSINRHTGHQLNRGIIMILSMAIVLLLTDRFREDIFNQSAEESAKTEGLSIGTVSPVAVESNKSNDYSCNIAEAARLYEKAISYYPDDPTPHHWYAILLGTTGRTALALEHIQIAKRIDPLISAVDSIEAELYRNLGDYAHADELHRTAASLGLYGGSLYPVGMNYLYAGEFEKGITLIEGGWVGQDPSIVIGDKLFIQALQDPAKQGALEKHIGKADESQPYIITDNQEFLAVLGSPYVFEHQADVKCALVRNSVWAESFREQRKTPEFFELMERAGIVEYWHEFGWPDDCESLDQTLAECK